MFLNESDRPRMRAGPKQRPTTPFLQTSYPNRCRSRSQRSRIGMRFPSSASPKTPLHQKKSGTTPFLQTFYPCRCRSTTNNVHRMLCASRHPLP